MPSGPPGPAARARREVPDDHPIALLQAHTLPALVQRELTRLILAGQLTAGSKLNEIEVAQRLGVSRGPVREAFRALEESGLVRLEKNRGVFVREVTPAEADEIFELRALLDEFAGRRAAERATPADIAALTSAVDGMAAAADAGDADLYFDLNLAFHDRIVALAGNAKLASLYRRLVNELALVRRAAFDRAGTLPRSILEHRAIVATIASGDADAAGRRLREHVLASRDRVRRARGAPQAPRPTAPDHARRPSRSAR
ncbi:MAG: phosphonate utilization associated transcriptional regulator [Betaproteobacteria bacterium]|jgi:phosphonate utilization transcriptional regulator|nr:phosphonate utilization associated transcriptional regulator [Betaproteobacteria bacterium]